MMAMAVFAATMMTMQQNPEKLSNRIVACAMMNHDELRSAQLEEKYNKRKRT